MPPRSLWGPDICRGLKARFNWNPCPYVCHRCDEHLMSLHLFHLLIRVLQNAYCTFLQLRCEWDITAWKFDSFTLKHFWFLFIPVFADTQQTSKSLLRTTSAIITVLSHSLINVDSLICVTGKFRQSGDAVCLLPIRSSTSRSWRSLKNWTGGREKCFIGSGDPKSPFLGSKFTRKHWGFTLWQKKVCWL